MTDALVFDSGVGGLSVYAEIRRRQAHLSLDYVCDNAALPYGTKPDAWLTARIVAVCLAACERVRPRALVVACNTASTLALEALREALSIPVIGTVPAVKTAAALSRSRCIGLLATSATLKRGYLDRLIVDFAGDCRVMRVAADALVLEAERRLAGEKARHEVLIEALAPLSAAIELDAVVLGCTHFPLLREALAAVLPVGVRWIDSGAAIAQRLATILGATVEPSSITPRDRKLARSFATRPDAPGLATALGRFGLGAPERLALAPVPTGSPSTPSNASSVPVLPFSQGE
ncbi:glutamate racemase [Salinicola halophilus]|uniref:glutamate racemase n=1 Tax=Salinicola halophilus TaxID=184065 RepID=UPI000DA116FF|nr:glutamate racemase [Salinicola halophilus]